MGFATGKGVERLAEFEVAEPDFGEWGKEPDDLFMALRMGRRDSVEIGVEAGGFGDREVENVVDGFSTIEEIEGGFFVAFPFAVRAGDIDVGEELHFNFLETISGAAVAAAIAGIEGEEAGLSPDGFGIRSAGEKLADGIERTEEDGWCGARSPGNRGLIYEFNGTDVLAALEFSDGGWIAFGFLS